MAVIKVTVERINGYCNQPRLVGDHFFVDGGKIVAQHGIPICMWALQSMMPIFPLIQRAGGDPSDWTAKVNRFQCPDPRGQVIYRLERMEEGS